MDANIEKDSRIKEVLSELFERFGQYNFKLTDYWDADLCAVGIRSSKDTEYLVYISTYQIQENHYFVEVEDSNKEVVLNGYKNGDLNEIDFEELSKIITEYLHLQPIIV